MHYSQFESCVDHSWVLWSRYRHPSVWTRRGDIQYNHIFLPLPVKIPCFERPETMRTLLFVLWPWGLWEKSRFEMFHCLLPFIHTNYYSGPFSRRDSARSQWMCEVAPIRICFDPTISNSSGISEFQETISIMKVTVY
jgi:hypothetical protein